MTNDEFLLVLNRSFDSYLSAGARSNRKLKILHKAIADDLASRLDSDYQVHSLGRGTGKEDRIEGRYMPKAVDISICKDGDALGGVAVKYIMSNYSQNSNNYFENMLGETANLRCNRKAYFQVVVLPTKLPYFDQEGNIKKIEEVKEHNLRKYIKLSEDNTDFYMHTPTLTLLYLVKSTEFDPAFVKTRADYERYFSHEASIGIKTSEENYSFGGAVVCNDYELFARKIVHYFEFVK